MADLFAPWGFWSGLAGAVEAAPPPFATLDAVLLDLPTLELRGRAADRGRKGIPVLIVAPFALHDAAIADFADGFSLAAVLDLAGPVALTRWKSATAEMRLLTIDSYLAELNVAVDELGGRAVLVGLCQGGWLAAVYAARFPAKVAALVVAGAPIDLAAAPSQIQENVAATPSFWLHGYLSAFGGLAPGEHRRMHWTRESLDTTAREALQREPTPAGSSTPSPACGMTRVAAWLIQARSRGAALRHSSRQSKGCSCTSTSVVPVASPGTSWFRVERLSGSASTLRACGTQPRQLAVS